jgi:outer membrane protein assembly factor BamB
MSDLHFLLRLQFSVLFSVTVLGAQVLTYHNDIERTGLNPNETILTPANVNHSTFGKVFLTVLDGRVDAQPLYVPSVTIASHGLHNVLIVATENDSVYALDADIGAVLWQTRTLKSSEVPSDPRNCGQVTPEIGITGTPVINMGTSPPTIYVHQKINRRRCGW